MGARLGPQPVSLGLSQEPQQSPTAPRQAASTVPTSALRVEGAKGEVTETGFHPMFPL